MRAGESLVEMDDMTLAILNETLPDFSSKIVEGLLLPDMDEIALENFKSRWVQKTGRQDYRDFTTEKMLRNIGIMSDDGINYAGLILFAKRKN